MASDNIEMVESGFILGHPYHVRPYPLGASFNGYVILPFRMTVEEGYRGILSYVPVHGGITYAKTSGLKRIYGFDTGHCDSKEYPIEDLIWIRGQCRIMLRGIYRAVLVEWIYLLAKILPISLRNKIRARICQFVVNANPNKEYWNFGIGINLLSGEL